MIPDAAVEAAMKHFPPLYRSVVAAALESAAPHMLAQFRSDARKPLADDAFFATLRGLNPSAALLRDIEAVERDRK